MGGQIFIIALEGWIAPRVNLACLLNDGQLQTQATPSSTTAATHPVAPVQEKPLLDGRGFLTSYFDFAEAMTSSQMLTGCVTSALVYKTQ